MRELDTLARIRRIVEIATGEPYGDGYIVTDICVGYAEPGYGRTSDAVIVFGDWNDKRNAEGKSATLPSRLARVLEAAGAEIEWLDEWTQCQGCYRAVRTEPDSYSWKPSYAWVNECEIYCADCLREDPESLVEEYVNEPTKALTFLDGSDLEALGFEQENGDYENGWHEGMNDDPTAIMARIHKFNPDAEVVFILKESSQFYITFTAYVRTPAED